MFLFLPTFGEYFQTDDSDNNNTLHPFLPPHVAHPNYSPHHGSRCHLAQITEIERMLNCFVQGVLFSRNAGMAVDV